MVDIPSSWKIDEYWTEENTIRTYFFERKSDEEILQYFYFLQERLKEWGNNNGGSYYYYKTYNLNCDIHQKNIEFRNNVVNHIDYLKKTLRQRMKKVDMQIIHQKRIINAHYFQYFSYVKKRYSDAYIDFLNYRNELDFLNDLVLNANNDDGNLNNDIFQLKIQKMDLKIKISAILNDFQKDPDKQYEPHFLVHEKLKSMLDDYTRTKKQILRIFNISFSQNFS